MYEAVADLSLSSPTVDGSHHNTAFKTKHQPDPILVAHLDGAKPAPPLGKGFYPYTQWAQLACSEK